MFSLIGPKKYDVPWRDLEGRGWIAEAVCTEVRCALPRHGRMAYATAQPRDKFRIAAEEPGQSSILLRHAATSPRGPDAGYWAVPRQLQQIAARPAMLR